MVYFRSPVNQIQKEVCLWNTSPAWTIRIIKPCNDLACRHGREIHASCASIYDSPTHTALRIIFCGVLPHCLYQILSNWNPSVCGLIDNSETARKPKPLVSSKTCLFTPSTGTMTTITTTTRKKLYSQTRNIRFELLKYRWIEDLREKRY